MRCPECGQLEGRLDEARASFSYAMRRLYVRIGVCPKEEFQVLSAILHGAQQGLNAARTALDEHVGPNCCLSLDSEDTGPIVVPSRQHDSNLVCS